MAFSSKSLGRVPVIGKKELDVLELKTLFLLASEQRLTTSEILNILRIDEVKRKAVIERLKKNFFLEYRTDIKPKNIKLKSAPLGDSVIRQSKVGQPGFVFSLNSELFRRVSEEKKHITPELIEEVKSSGMIERLTDFYEKFILLNQDFFTQFANDINDLILEPHRKDLANLPFYNLLQNVRGINDPGEV